MKSTAGLEEPALKVLRGWADVKVGVQSAGRTLPVIVVGPSLVKRYAQGEFAALEGFLKRPELGQKNPFQDYVYLVTEGFPFVSDVLQTFRTAEEARQSLGERPMIYFRGDAQEQLFSEETDPRLMRTDTLPSKYGPLDNFRYLLAGIRLSIEGVPEEKQHLFSLKRASLRSSCGRRPRQSVLPSHRKRYVS